MPFKNEEMMKEAINGLEQLVGEDKWCSGKMVETQRVPVCPEISASVRPVEPLQSLESVMSVKEVGVAYCAVGSMDRAVTDEYVIARKGFPDAIPERMVEQHVMNKFGLTDIEIGRTIRANDREGAAAVIEYWRSIGFDKED